ncbi:hypothetical protein L6164_015434 [Bauhinia variegata]|uniref:Uncharacterized protein n=1 Tax=Bauhinia variegata TaxID=167791 RepID=A0ACB9NMB7_BAUVA|nr:hypothetical protein L6164_015434 [Bauhinia variegata]
MPLFLHSKSHVVNKPLDQVVVEKVRAILKEVDGDGDGRLTRDELKKAFDKLGAWFPAFRTKLALNAADKNGDGVISGDLETEELIYYILDRCRTTATSACSNLNPFSFFTNFKPL